MQLQGTLSSPHHPAQPLQKPKNAFRTTADYKPGSNYTGKFYVGFVWSLFWNFWGHTWSRSQRKQATLMDWRGLSLTFMWVWTECCRERHGLRCLCGMHSFKSYHVASLIPRKDAGCGFVVEVRGSWKALISRCKLWYDSWDHWHRFHVFCSGVAWSEWRKEETYCNILRFVLTGYLGSFSYCSLFIVFWMHSCVVWWVCVWCFGLISRWTNGCEQKSSEIDRNDSDEDARSPRIHWCCASARSNLGFQVTMCHPTWEGFALVYL